MKKNVYLLLLALLMPLLSASAQEHYVPTESNLKARQDFADSKLGIFIHWGIYSMFAQGEWYMTNANLDNREYAKAASAFYPICFDADAWVEAIKDAGAKYICFTSCILYTSILFSVGTSTKSLFSI